MSILICSAACSKYVSKRIPVGNAIYLAKSPAPANKNPAQPLSLCTPDSPCIGQDAMSMQQVALNDTPTSKNNTSIMPAHVHHVKIHKTSKEKRIKSNLPAHKAKNKRKIAKVIKDKSNKSVHGVVISEDLSKNNDFVPLSHSPDKVYTDEQRSQMYIDKEATQQASSNKAAQLVAPKTPTESVTADIPTMINAQPSRSAASVDSLGDAHEGYSISSDMLELPNNQQSAQNVPVNMPQKKNSDGAENQKTQDAKSQAIPSKTVATVVPATSISSDMLALPNNQQSASEVELPELLTPLKPALVAGSSAPIINSQNAPVNMPQKKNSDRPENKKTQDAKLEAIPSKTAATVVPATSAPTSSTIPPSTAEQDASAYKIPPEAITNID